MKKLLALLAVSAFLTACNNSSEPSPSSAADSISAAGSVTGVPDSITAAKDSAGKIISNASDSAGNLLEKVPDNLVEKVSKEVSH